MSKLFLIALLSCLLGAAGLGVWTIASSNGVPKSANTQQASAEVPAPEPQGHHQAGMGLDAVGEQRAQVVGDRGPHPHHGGGRQAEDLVGEGPVVLGHVGPVLGFLGAVSGRN